MGDIHVQMTDKECCHIVAIICKAQSIIHDIDEIRGTSIFKHELKRKCNQINSDFERILSPYYKLLGYDSLPSLDEAFKKLDAFASEVKFIEKNHEPK